MFAKTFIAALVLSLTCQAQAAGITRVCGWVKPLTGNATHNMVLKTSEGKLILDASNPALSAAESEKALEIIDALSMHQWVCLEGIVDSAKSTFIPLN